MKRLVLMLAVGTAFAAGAQDFTFEGLKIKRPKKVVIAVDAGTATAALPAADAGVAVSALVDAGTTPVPAVPPADLADGDPVLALPPVWANKVDVENYKLLHAALRERLGARLVSDELTLVTIEKQKLLSTLATSDGQRRLGAAVKADLVAGFEISAAKVTASLMSTAGGLPEATVTMPTPKGRKLTLALARGLVADLINEGRSVIESTPALDLTAAAPAEPATVPMVSESTDDVDGPQEPSQVVARPAEFRPSWLSVFAGGGASFRSLDATSSTTVVPSSPSTIAALGFDVKLFPLRLVRSLADSKAAELWVEGQYRLNLVQASVDTAGTSTRCTVNDDEVLGRVGYRYALPGMLPHLGVTVGLANERTHFACSAPALDTTYTGTEYHLTVWQPILSGQRLALELAGGPRLLFSTRASGFQTLAFSAEGWLTSRPTGIFTLRAGARVTGTRLTTWPDGVSLFDLRTFIGLEVGAAL